MADDTGKAYFTDKSSTHAQSGADSVCGPNVVGITVSGTARFYRAVAVGAN
jgi:hypothetical protein